MAAMAPDTARTLVLIRHAKSDWDVPVPDRERPVATRGRRQASASGRWIAEHLPALDLAVVSVARRARDTWDLVSAELATQPRMEVSETAYTFDGDDLLEIMRSLPADATVAAIVGHNPAMEEIVETLAARWVAMPTSAIAVLELGSWDAPVGSATIRYAGRPADE